MLDPSVFQVDPQELARKLVNGLIPRGSDFLVNNCQTLIECSVQVCSSKEKVDPDEQALREVSTLTVQELAYLVVVATNTLISQGALA